MSAAWLTPIVPYLAVPDARHNGLLEAFGSDLRAARLRRSMTQMRLEERSGVDQTTISRLERARAPGVPLYKLLALYSALSDELPFGHCPHDHGCRWTAATVTSSRPSFADVVAKLRAEFGLPARESPSR